MRLRVRVRRLQIEGRAGRKLRAVGMGCGRSGNRRADSLLRGKKRKRRWLIAHAQLSPADPAADASALAALAADATGAAVPPVDVAASAAVSDDTAPADDSRASTASLIDAVEGTVPLVAGSATGISADAAATVDDAGALPTDAVEFGCCCRCPFDRENIGLSISFKWSHSSNAESEITAVGGERVPLDGCSRRWRRARKGGPALANDAVVFGCPDI